ncbi:MAG: hypothetical protein GY793_07685 [Proteobacteria bacterium]|nr:hypothetical protein [Pseudomonadota bacterium]
MKKFFVVAVLVMAILAAPLTPAAADIRRLFQEEIKIPSVADKVSLTEAVVRELKAKRATPTEILKAEITHLETRIILADLKRIIAYKSSANEFAYKNHEAWKADHKIFEEDLRDTALWMEKEQRTFNSLTLKTPERTFLKVDKKTCLAELAFLEAKTRWVKHNKLKPSYK